MIAIKGGTEGKRRRPSRKRSGGKRVRSIISICWAGKKQPNIRGAHWIDPELLIILQIKTREEGGGNSLVG